MTGIASVLTLNALTSDTKGGRIDGSEATGRLGVPVAGIGDINGDGYSDLPRPAGTDAS